MLVAVDMITLNVATEFSRTPGPRLISEGKHSGEKFRKEVLEPKMREAIRLDTTLKIILDGAAGYGTSFLEESFGGLIRIDNIDYDEIVKRLEIITDEEPYLKEDIYEYLDDAAQNS